MSSQELDRLTVIRRVLEGRLTQIRAGQLLDLHRRQVRRLCKAYRARGPSGLVSGLRGRPSNRRLPEALREQAIALVREHYADFGPKLAHEKLLELHDLRVSVETLRTWLTGAGIWVPRRERERRAHQPRYRRACFGELVQIDGCEHPWFEDRAPGCTLLVYVDDATGKLMELRFVKSESAFDYFAATRSYLLRFGRPVAFYSDKHSVFRVAREGSTGRGQGATQFGRALAELNIDILCANSPQAKGRVERMNLTLQDRLVKELRLKRISTPEAANAFAPAFMEDYNRRFARSPKNPHDAHRPLRGKDDLDRIFCWQEERTMSRNLVVHFKRKTYLVEPSKATQAFGGKRVLVREWEDGRVELSCGARVLPYSVYDPQPNVSRGEVVENKRLGAVLALVQTSQEERDRARLESKGLTLREKERIRASRTEAGAPEEPAPKVKSTSRRHSELLPMPAQVKAYLQRFEAEQRERQRAKSEKAARQEEPARQA